ncbi:unnamed protein product [Nezara viridula]|uniref:Uncharacterized protein n=1 Tax=Nezara viridula TaxID=85310 RepID=A0A9P0H1T4_NEZVI|nr:unnamed protein product [Nezara viridula]
MSVYCYPSMGSLIRFIAGSSLALNRIESFAKRWMWSSSLRLEDYAELDLSLELIVSELSNYYCRRDCTGAGRPTSRRLDRVSVD